MTLKIITLLFGLVCLVGVGCKKKADQNQQAVVPAPIDTTPKIDTSQIMASDTMTAVEQVSDLPSAPRGSGFVVQVASATDAKYARYLVDLWKSRGYEPFVTTFSYKNETHYRVRLGLFESISQAKKVMAELGDKYSMKTWIDQMSN